ncbi:hypothetical protein [Nonomuraea fuscirosea]
MSLGISQYIAAMRPAVPAMAISAMSPGNRASVAESPLSLDVWLE